MPLFTQIGKSLKKEHLLERMIDQPIAMMILGMEDKTHGHRGKKLLGPVKHGLRLLVAKTIQAFTWTAHGMEEGRMSPLPPG